MKYFLVILIFITSFFSFYTPIIKVEAAGNTFYVSPSGNDSNPGTLAQPFKTIQGNMWRLQAGDTMVLRGGDYPEDVTINNSGSAGLPITFKAYQNEKPYIIGNPARTTASQGVYVYNKDYIIFDGINVRNFAGHWMSIWLSSNITVKNCEFSNNTLNIIGFYIIHSDHLIVQNCTMDKVFDNTQTQDKDLIYVENTHYSIFENLTLTRGQHSLIGMQNSTFNVVRNNILKNDWQKNIGVASPASTALGRNIIENNLIYGSRPAIAPGYTGKGAMGIYLNQKGNIVRRNQIYDNTNFGILVDGNNALGNSNVNLNKIYNNTILKNGLGGNYAESAGITITNFGTNLSMANNTIKNNVISENGVYNIYVRSNGAGLDNNAIQGNCIYKPSDPNSSIYVNGSGANSVSFFQNTFASLFNNDYDINPGLTNNNLSSIDLKLLLNSGCVDKGVALTKTSNAGSGNTIQVEDASYFFDGYGITDGDDIMVGTQTAKITAIDYNTNSITLNKTVTWGAQTSVNQVYKGSAPDPGYFENEAVVTKPLGCTGDYNQDGIVNIIDFAIFGQNYKKTGISCSLDITGGNCMLDIADFAELGKVYKDDLACR